MYVWLSASAWECGLVYILICSAPKARDIGDFEMSGEDASEQTPIGIIDVLDVSWNISRKRIFGRERYASKWMERVKGMLHVRVRVADDAKEL